MVLGILNVEVEYFQNQWNRFFAEEEIISQELLVEHNQSKYIYQGLRVSKYVL